MFFIIGIFVAMFLILLLLIKKNKSRADKILVLWLILMSINQLFHYFTFEKTIYEYPHLLRVDLAIPILIGVFLYFYVMEITGNKLKKNWTTFLHFLPFVIIALLAIPFYIISGPEKIYVFENDGEGFEWYTKIQNSVIAISGLFYSIWSLVIIKRHQKKIKDTFSNTDKKELQWLRLLSVGFAVIWVLSAFFGNVVIFSAVVIFVLCIAVFGINELSIFNSINVIEDVLEQEMKVPNEKETIKERINFKPTSEKYKKSGLNEEMALQIYTNLNVLVEETAIYKNEELTLVELAKQLKIHPNHLSQVINKKEGKNFYNYINALRIKEFIRIASLSENKKYTMISLAYDCGFSTKSTFNRHFKLQTGKTPTHFFNA